MLEPLELLYDVPLADGQQEEAFPVASKVPTGHGDRVVRTDQHEPVLAEPGTRNTGSPRAPADDLEGTDAEGPLEPWNRLVEVANDVVNVMDAHGRLTGPPAVRRRRSTLPRPRPLLAGEFARMQRPAEPIQLVNDGQDRVPEQHARSGIAHDCPGLLSLRGLVTVNGAVRTGRLGAAVRAFLQPNFCVVQELRAFTADTRANVAMMVAAINADHPGNGPELPCQPPVLEAQLRRP